MTSICGVDCSECKDFEKTCSGCSAIKGKVYWAPFAGLDVCPMYACCVDKKSLAHCGKCSELPCTLYYETRDPSVGDAEHEQGIKKRVEILAGLS